MSHAWTIDHRHGARQTEIETLLGFLNVREPYKFVPPYLMVWAFSLIFQFMSAIRRDVALFTEVPSPSDVNCNEYHLTSAIAGLRVHGNKPAETSGISVPFSLT